MNYADIKQYDVANGPGVRVSLFVSGCRHACKGCFNYTAWDFGYGKEFTDETLDELMKLIARDYIKGLTILGGEPLEPSNQEVLINVIRRFRKEFPQKSLWCYTGFDFEKDVMRWMVEYLPHTKEIIENLDVLVDGKFVQELYKPGLRFKGSSNQRLISIPDYLKTGEIVLWDDLHPLKKY